MNPTDYKWAVSELNLKTNVRRAFVFNDAGYREIISFNGFFHGLKNRNLNGNWNDGLLYFVVHTGAFERIAGFKCWENDLAESIKKDNVIICENLYDFYKKIGFNRKTKKYEFNNN